MKSYVKPNLELEEIISEDVILSSGIQLPEDEFDDESSGYILPEENVEP